MINIVPDPKHPSGGFAKITISDVDPFDEPVEVSVFNSYQQKWLGHDGWQPNRVKFPAQTVQWDDRQLTLTVGPELVNAIEEDAPIRIRIGKLEYDTCWPNNINPSPDYAHSGAIGASLDSIQQDPSPPPPPEIPELPTQLQATETPKPAGNIQSTETPKPPEHIQSEETPQRFPRPKQLFLVVGSIAAVMILAIAAWFLFDEEKSITAETDDATSSACDNASLNAVVNDELSVITDKLRTCAEDVTTDDALSFVERGVSANRADALLLFGILYDEGVTDDIIEMQIGLTFPDQASLAAEYYSRAIKAGSIEAKSLLQNICGRLALENNTLTRSAHEDYCQEL